MVQSRQPLTYKLMEAQDDMEATDREGLQRVEARLSTLMIDKPGDLV